MEKQKYNNQKELEKLRNKKLLMPKMYSFIEVRELIELVDKEFEIIKMRSQKPQIQSDLKDIDQAFQRGRLVERKEFEAKIEKIREFVCLDDGGTGFCNCENCKEIDKIKEDKYYPIQFDGHWNCGICNCSHEYYNDALNCCKDKNQVRDKHILEIREIIRELKNLR